MTSPVSTADRDANATRNGVIAAVMAHLLWGFLPLLFRSLHDAGAALIVAERTLWSLVLLTAIICIGGNISKTLEFLSDRRRLVAVVAAATLLMVNWLLYVWAVETQQVLQTSFGNFINPIVNVALGMVFLGERHNRVQVLSISIAGIAIVIQAIGLGTVPVVALGIALTFGFYGLIRKQVQVGPAIGLFAETAIMAPLALGYVAFDLMKNGIGVHGDPGSMALFVLTGPATAIPLLLFAYGLKRLRLTTLGMLQYVAPSIQFLIAIFLFGEAIDPFRLISFGLIWVSLLIFSLDVFRR